MERGGGGGLSARSDAGAGARLFLRVVYLMRLNARLVPSKFSPMRRGEAYFYRS